MKKQFVIMHNKSAESWDTCTKMFLSLTTDALFATI